MKTQIRSYWDITLTGISSKGSTKESRKRLQASLRAFMKRHAKDIPVEVAGVQARGLTVSVAPTD